MTVEFIDAPPPSNRTNWGELHQWLAEVKANPGKWAKRVYGSAKTASSTGTHLRGQGFEATTRGADLYVRWPK